MPNAVELIWSALWADNPAAGRLILLVIAALLLRVLHVGTRASRRYRQENVALSRVGERLAEWRFVQRQSEGRESANEPSADEHDEDTGAASGGAETDAETEEDDESGETVAPPLPGQTDTVTTGPERPRHLLEGVDPRSLIAERIGAIDQMLQHQMGIDTDTLQRLTALRDASRSGNQFPPFAARICMMLGILGTFVGLAAMVQQIDLGLPRGAGDIDLALWTDSLNHLRSVLGGMKTAFSTSLAGMGAAIVSSSVGYRIRRERHHVLERLEQLTSEELLPAMVPAHQQGSLLDKVSRQLEESFRWIDEISRQNRDALRQLNAVQAAFVEIVDEVRDIARSQSARNLDSLIDQVGTANESVLQVARQLPRIASSLDRTGKRIEQAVREAPPVPTGTPGNADNRLLGLSPSGWLLVLVALAVGLGLLQVAGG